MSPLWPKLHAVLLNSKLLFILFLFIFFGCPIIFVFNANTLAIEWPECLEELEWCVMILFATHRESMDSEVQPKH